VLEDRVDLPRLYLAWPSPPLFAGGDAELDLAADVLATGRTSRLYKRLVYDRRVATEISAAQSSRELVSTFQVGATAAPGETLETLRATIVEEIDRLRRDGPDDELARGRAQAEAAFVYRVHAGRVRRQGRSVERYNVIAATGRLRRRPGALSRGHAGDGARRDARWIDPAKATALSVIPRNN
jgi:zinc protease